MAVSLLNTPAPIGPLKLKNRVIMAPLGTNYGTTDGLSTERDKQYYAERAIGGVAMIMTEAMIVSENARNHHNSLCVFHDRFIPGLAAVVDAVKAHGALVVGQLSHRGGLLRRDVLNMEPVGPSPWRNPNTGDAVRPLTEREIIAIELNYVHAARRLYRAGYDGLELHAANGYLFHQFFSGRVNKRTDRYGGSIENRMRFLLETIARIQDALPSFPILVRFSATEYVQGGYTEAEVVELARALERAGVVALDLSGGTNESPELSRYCIQTPSFPRGGLAPFARPIKQAVSIPVILAGRIIEPEDAEAILAAGTADFISLGRALVADAHWCLKAFGQMSSPIRRCISCNVCFERLTLERDMSCVQNPMVGTEFEGLRYLQRDMLPAPERRRVLVLGAGVAGIEAANRASARGHEVEIWEAAARPGGQVALAIAAPEKGEVLGVWTERWAECQARGIRVRLNTQTTAEKIHAFAPDLVVVATGARPRTIDLQWPTSIRVIQAWDVLANSETIPTGSDVVIIGGGMVGIETADLLAARACRITVIEAQAQVAREMARNNRTEVLLRLKSAGVAIVTGASVCGIRGGDLIIARDGTESTLPLPTYAVMAVGPIANRDVVPLLDSMAVPYVVVGDTHRPGDFLTAIRDGWMAGLGVEHLRTTTNGLRPRQLARSRTRDVERDGGTRETITFRGETR